MIDDDISTKNKEVREVYARFGLAIYSAQCLEHGLVNSFLYLHLIPSKMSSSNSKEWEDEMDSFTSKHFEHTLGRMIKDLEKFTNVPQNLSKKLSEALKIRNWLAHDYFRERAREFMSFEGRMSMIEELDIATNTMNDADAELSLVIDPMLKKYGISEDLINKVSEEMLSKPKE